MAALNHLTDRQVGLFGPEAHDGEDDEPGKHTGGAVGDGNQDGVPMAVVVELVVGGQSNQSSKCRAQGVEDLSGGCGPDLHLLQALQLLQCGVNIEEDPIIGSLQCGSSDQQDEEDEVRKESW